LQVDRFARDLQCAGEAREERSERKDRREQRRLRDAQSASRLAILRRRADPDAPARSLQQPGEHPVHERPDHDHEQRVLRDKSAKDFNAAGEPGRAWRKTFLRSPGEQHDVLQHQHEAERGEQLKDLGSAIDPSQHDDLDQRAEHADCNGGQQHASEKARRGCRHCCRQR
jgi:hypothetical protein